MSSSRPRTTHCKTVPVPSSNQHKPAKKTRSGVPPPQRVRIIQKYVEGKSVSQIGREEGRNRETITKIVNGEEVIELVQTMRAQLYGLAPDAIAAVRRALQDEKDGRLGYKILMDIGAAPPPEEARGNAIQAGQPEQEELTPFERASAQDGTGKINRIQLALARHAENIASIYGGPPLPTPDEMLHNHTIAALINEMTGGRHIEIDLSDGILWNRLKALAEDVLGGKRGMTDPEILRMK